MFIIDNQLKAIKMNENDYGIILTLTLDEIQEGSKFNFKVYTEKEVLIDKDISSNGTKTIEISLTQEESNKLKQGKYNWSCRQYINNKLNNTILNDKLFIVEEGA